MVKQWMVVRGLEPVRNPDGDVLCVVVTDDVLDGACSTKDAETIERLRGRGVPVISVHDTTQIWRATARVRARLAGSGWRHSSSHDQGA
jgi:rRNA-processing protein FCF1